eukprot:m.143396 g.143396  ORF g.143396 m.143396 type:complete len:118 (+) comp30316_c0_seq3:1331-1684(+)
MIAASTSTQDCFNWERVGWCICAVADQGVFLTHFVHKEILQSGRHIAFITKILCFLNPGFNSCFETVTSLTEHHMEAGNVIISIWVSVVQVYRRFQPSRGCMCGDTSVKFSSMNTQI